MKSIIRWGPLAALFGLALLGLALRLYGLDWDQGNSFHPDERQILFHVTLLSWPNSVAQFLDPVSSPLNPHFFAYGSFPLYFLALVGSILVHFFPALGTIAHFALIGRVLSALFDSGTILLTGWLGLLLAKEAVLRRRSGWAVALLAAALVAFTPLQLQLSHFYAVDTMLLFFVMLTLLACVALVDTDAPVRWSLVAGLGYGLALATKFSAAPLVLPLLVAVLLRWSRRDLVAALGPCFGSLATTGLVFLVVMPYALLDLGNFREQVAEQGDLARGLLDLPYVRQFAGTIPYLYEAQNILLWGMGAMLGLAALAGFAWLLWRLWRREASLWLVVLAWIIPYSVVVGGFYVKFMRYMLPIYPFLTLMAAALLVACASATQKRRSGSLEPGSLGDRKGPHPIPHHLRGRNELGPYRVRRSRSQKPIFERLSSLPIVSLVARAAIVLVLAGTVFQGVALLNVYSQPNTRVQASRWIYGHLRPGSILIYEQWDDPLPVPVDGNYPASFLQATYPDSNGQLQTGLDLYGEDTLQKAQQLAMLLPTIDAITMATDRLDRSILRLPSRYPLTIHYYQMLFSGQLGFHLAARFENHPHLFGVTLNDSGADESYSVFDHPTVRVFVRDSPYPYTSDQLLHKLLAGMQLPPS